VEGPIVSEPCPSASLLNWTEKGGVLDSRRVANLFIMDSGGLSETEEDDGEGCYMP
jgi:hypothetical protein